MSDTTTFILDQYGKLVRHHHAARFGAWPVLSGYNVTVGQIGDHAVHMFEHTGTSGVIHSKGVGDISASISGATAVTPENMELVRKNLARHFRVAPDGGIVFLEVRPDGKGTYEARLPTGELEKLLLRHEHVMGLAPMKIFLSHKSADKTMLRDFASTLRELGFDPWLDEDAMTAGSHLGRSLLKGFGDSCAVVFFVTENFADKDYLATEVDYAIKEKRAKGDKFAIITLCFNGATANVPELLKTYVFKQPTTQLQALREILRALPIQAGDVRWRV